MVPVSPVSALSDAPRLLYVTMPDRQTAETMARDLVENRLVACANLLPGMVSVYAWQGMVEQSEEIAVLLKTIAGKVAAIKDALARAHPYETPCLIALAVDEDRSSADFLAWIRASVRA